MNGVGLGCLEAVRGARRDNLMMKTQRKMKIGMSHIASLERITIQVSIRISGDTIARNTVCQGRSSPRGQNLVLHSYLILPQAYGGVGGVYLRGEVNNQGKGSEISKRHYFQQKLRLRLVVVETVFRPARSTKYLELGQDKPFSFLWIGSFSSKYESKVRCSSVNKTCFAVNQNDYSLLQLPITREENMELARMEEHESD